MPPPARISLEHCETYEMGAVRAAIECALELFGGMGAFVRPGARVLLKPNFISGMIPRPVEAAATTHPSVIITVAQLVRDCGAEPFVADSPAFGRTESVARVTGLTPLAEKMGLPVATLNAGEWRATHRVAVKELRISKDVLAADVVINLPKFKAHQQMLMSLAVKNLFGCIPGRRKAMLHLQSRDDHAWFGRMLIENYLLVRPALTIMDGIVAMEGCGPLKGSPKPMGIVMAGTDCVAMDRVAVELIGLEWRRLFTLAAAAEMGVGETDLSRIVILGRTIEEMLVPDFQLPRLTPISFSPYRVVKGWVKNQLLQMRSQPAG
jgi:uncharacterized protein (DUF362 family)